MNIELAITLVTILVLSIAEFGIYLIVVNQLSQQDLLDESHQSLEASRQHLEKSKALLLETEKKLAMLRRSDINNK